ncbi:hypothetical protein [Chitinophaga silvisoli]|uniref:Lipoprotein n=1 Tax=Chitinophaga silvisoli TaxID=2291814 RepID=A0A3E1NRY3_9BACT|nr:hypothetical protein [Chitinophaga silvisoli]RFM30711.1 hypothetical protein DXN04_32750 [Chitinophaga silvisoli]
MKTRRLSWHVRKMALSLAFISGLALIVFSCKKDEDDGVITADEMAEAVVQSFSSEGGGLVIQTNAALSVVAAANTDNTGKLADQCGVPYEKTRTSANADTASYYVWSYGITWTGMLTCTEQVPTQYEFKATGRALYDFPRMSSDDSVNNKIVVTGLSNDSTFYKVSQTYIRTGTQQSKIGKMHKFTSTVTVSSTNMYVNKTTLRITSGTATVNIKGESSSGKSFTLSGTLTFSGNDAASLVLNDTKYTVSWIR